MKLEMTIQSMYDNYAILFQERWHVLDHLFCVIGNGYEWVNGQLVEVYSEIEKGYTPILNPNGKAEPRDNIRDREILEDYNRTMERNLEERKILVAFAKDLEEGRINQVQYDDTVRLYDKIYSIDKEVVMQSAIDFVSRHVLRDKEISFYPLCEYSKIFTYPEDIQDDWLEGIKEVVALLLEYGHGGDIGEMNEYQSEQHSKWTTELNKLANKLGVV